MSILLPPHDVTLTAADLSEDTAVRRAVPPKGPFLLSVSLLRERVSTASLTRRVRRVREHDVAQRSARRDGVERVARQQRQARRRLRAREDRGP